MPNIKKCDRCGRMIIPDDMFPGRNGEHTISLATDIPDANPIVLMVCRDCFAEFTHRPRGVLASWMDNEYIRLIRQQNLSMGVVPPLTEEQQKRLAEFESKIKQRMNSQSPVPPKPEVEEGPVHKEPVNQEGENEKGDDSNR